MSQQSSLRLVTLSILLFSVLVTVPVWGAQTPSSSIPKQLEETVAEVVDTADITPDPEQRTKDEQQAAIEQLREISESLSEKVSERRNLRRQIKGASEDLQPLLEEELESLGEEVALLEKTFEQIAIGGVDLSLFGETESKFDWREELVLIVQPLIENVKGLTEKPRKIESLRRAIETREVEIDASNDALSSIETLLEQAEGKLLVEKLNGIKQSWLDTKEDQQREVRLAEFQLASLEGKNTPWFEIVRESLTGFMTGRGLTLLLVILASILVWAFMAGLLWLFRKRSKESRDRSTKVHYRLAAYAYTALTAFLIAITVVTVLYLRQDLLLLVIVVIILFGLALALKNLLPRYVAEGRLLLNVGAVRERERVMYKGVPWQVVSINMFSKFSNPRINGMLRVPIAELHELVSRPTSAKDWFPSSEGDWIINGDDKLMQVVSQEVELVELRDMNKMSHFIPTAEYYAAGYKNLSSGDCFRVAVRFGIDYAHQRLDTVMVCDKFKAGLEENFSSAPFKDHVRKVDVEFDEAADSSLNYVMFALFETEAARHRNRIGRRIQAACVAVCNDQGWGIPFPQLTVHHPDDAGAEES